MNTKNFVDFLEDPSSIQKENTTSLEAIIDEYPYFQSARALYLKALKSEESFKYNSVLKITAAYTTDRTILFDFITSDVFISKTTSAAEVHQKVSEKITNKTPTKIKEELEIGKPILFSNTETYSFNEWLQLCTHKKVERTPKKSMDKKLIVDNFIKQNPKIIRVEKESKNVISVKENTSESHLMTETLAKVYLEQNKYENAIKAYEILSLKYPEKSGFFADQIKRIRILQKNKP
jgi:hypothetical protein